MIDGDTPVKGYYMTRLTRGGVPVRIWFGSPIIDNEEQDRSPRWLVEVDGKTDFVETGPEGYACRVPFDVYRYWPHCGRFPISEAEYRYQVGLTEWARSHAPHRPEAQRTKQIDVRGKSVF